MVRINKVATKTGDKGETSLADGTRRPKFDLRIEAYGTIDEANSQLGLVASYCPAPVQELIICIQNDLFDLGADLSKPLGAKAKESDIRMTRPQIDQLEEAIEQLNSNLPPLESFILPGGSILSGLFHIARTVVRRAERRICELASMEEINPLCVVYCNRLSDLLFILARQANYINPNLKKPETLWVPNFKRNPDKQ